MIKQLPATKASYRGKNINGGRKCLFGQSKAYKRAPKGISKNAAGIISVATRWGS